MSIQSNSSQTVSTKRKLMWICLMSIQSNSNQTVSTKTKLMWICLECESVSGKIIIWNKLNWETHSPHRRREMFMRLLLGKSSTTGPNWTGPTHYEWPLLTHYHVTDVNDQIENGAKKIYIYIRFNERTIACKANWSWRPPPFQRFIPMSTIQFWIQICFWS